MDDRPADDPGLGMLGEQPDVLAQEVLRHVAVAVDSRDDLPACGRNRKVQSVRCHAERVVDESQSREASHVVGDDLSRGIVGSAVGDDDLHTIGRIILREDAVERGRR